MVREALCPDSSSVTVHAKVVRNPLQNHTLANLHLPMYSKGVSLFVVKPVLFRTLQKRIGFFSYPIIPVINVMFKKRIKPTSQC